MTSDSAPDPAQDQSSLRLQYAALSDLGRHRKDNQDAGFASEHLLVVADGVGGAAYGDVASHTAIQILRRLDEPPNGDVLEALAGAIHRVHDRLAELVEDDPELEGTSTTVTAGLFDGSRLGLAHLGDSRAYLLRGGEISRVTQDHTFVQSLIDEGRITEAEARNHPHRNLILRAVDSVHDTEPDLFYLELLEGDRLLFCSDGCSGVLDDDAVGEVLGKGTVDFAAVELVRTSLDRGTTDNVTVVVADVVGADTVDDPETSAASATGPMLVGAAASQPRKLAGDGPGLKDRSRFRRQDTGEIPVAGDEDDVDPEALRYALRAPRRLLWVRRLGVVLLLVLLLAGAGTVAYAWTQQQYYVAEDQDVVAIYKGVDFDLPVVSLSEVVEHSQITMDALPEFRAEQVRDGITAGSLDEARQRVEDILGVATKCPEPEPQRPQPRAPRNPDATRTPSPTPSPTPTLAPPDCIEATS